MNAEKCLKSVYYTLSNEGSFGGNKRLKEAVFKDTVVHMSDKQVSEWLAGEDAYTLHRPAQINYKRNRVIVHGIDIQFQADLVDMSMYTKENDNFKYMLTCIDVFSKYAWTRVLKNKTGVEVTKAFESILKEGRIPQKLQFFNKYFQDVTTKYNIHHFSTGSEQKASIVECFNRTIKGRMWRYITAINSKRYIDVLQDLITSYNNSYHMSIKMRPYPERTKINLVWIEGHKG